MFIFLGEIEQFENKIYKFQLKNLQINVIFSL